MIIPALVDLYDRILDAGDDTLAPKGYSRQQVSFKVVLNKNGSLHRFEAVQISVPRDTRRRVKGHTVTETRIEHRPALLLLPGQSKPSGSGLNPCFLWDNSAYMLGFKADDPNPERTQAAFAAFRERHSGLAAELDDRGFGAVAKFLSSWRPSDARAHRVLAEITAHFGVFQLRGESGYVHERPEVRAWWERAGVVSEPESANGGSSMAAPSLATASTQPIARLHEPRIKGVAGAQSSGATIVSFNQDAFTSFGKDQSFNAPVGVGDAFKYCTALNRLTTDDKHRVRIAGDTVVFWTAGEAATDAAACGWFAAALDDSAVTVDRLKGLLEAAREGEVVREFGDPSTPFYVLALSPNMSRLSVRLWLVSTVGDVTRRIGDHLRGLQLDPPPGESPLLSIRRLVNETVPPKAGFPDSDRVSPTLAAAVTQSVMRGTPYPRALFAGVVDRVRIEGLADSQTRKDFRAAQHRRCAVIRACLTRNHRMEVPVSLDPDRSDPPYLLGRLFAVLERAQQNALGLDINRTIKDSYYGSASSTPATIFPRLLSLARHHLNKIENPGQRVTRERELGAIMDRIIAFPRLLGLEAQGLFAIGYYHQRQSYFNRPRDASE